MHTKLLNYPLPSIVEAGIIPFILQYTPKHPQILFLLRPLYYTLDPTFPLRPRNWSKTELRLGSGD